MSYLEEPSLPSTLGMYRNMLNFLQKTLVWEPVFCRWMVRMQGVILQPAWRFIHIVVLSLFYILRIGSWRFLFLKSGGMLSFWRQMHGRRVSLSTFTKSKASTQQRNVSEIQADWKINTAREKSAFCPGISSPLIFYVLLSSIKCVITKRL